MSGIAPVARCALYDAASEVVVLLAQQAARSSAPGAAAAPTTAHPDLTTSPTLLARVAALSAVEVGTELTRLRRVLVCLCASETVPWGDLADALLVVVSAFPDRGRRDPAALYALEVLLDAALELETRLITEDALPDAPAAAKRACPRVTHVNFLFDAVRDGGQRGERAAACCAVLTRICYDALCVCVEVALPRLAAAAGSSSEAQGWEAAAPIVRCAAGWRWCLRDSHPGACAATSQFLSAVATRTLPSLHHGAAQRPAASCMTALALGVRAAALEAPTAWYSTQTSATCEATARACNDVYTCLKTWSKKPHGKAACLAAMGAFMAAAPPLLFTSPRRHKLVQALYQDMASKDDESRLAAMGLAADLLRAVPHAAVSRPGANASEWSEDVSALITAACGFTGTAKRSLVPTAPHAGAGATAALPHRLQRQAAVSLLCAVARFDVSACCDAIQRLALSPAHGPRATGLGAAAAVLNAPAAASAGGLEEAQRAKAESLLLAAAPLLVPAIKAALAPHTVVGSLPDEAALDAVAAAMGCMPLIIPRGSSMAAAAAATTPSPAGVALGQHVDETVALLHGISCGDHPGMASAARSTLRWCVTRVPTSTLVTLLRQSVRCCSCSAHRGNVPQLLSIQNTAVAGSGAGAAALSTTTAAWMDALTLMLAALDECAARASGTSAWSGQASSAGSGSGTPASPSSPAPSPGTFTPAGLPTGPAWTRIRIACEGVALLALSHPAPSAWPLARAVAIACAVPALRDLETGGRSSQLLPASRERQTRFSAGSGPPSPGGPGANGIPNPLETMSSRSFLADGLDGAAASLFSHNHSDKNAGQGCSPEVGSLLRLMVNRPTVAMTWAWRKVHACEPWKRTSLPPDATTWACQLWFLCAAVRPTGENSIRSGGGGGGGSSFSMGRSSLDIATPAGATAFSPLSVGTGSVRGANAAAAVQAEMAATEGTTWLAKDRMAAELVERLFGGLWQTLTQCGAESAPGRSILAAVTHIQASCHDVFLKMAAAKPAATRATYLYLLAALCGPTTSGDAHAPSPSVVSALDAALEDFLKTESQACDSAYEQACATAIAARLRTSTSSAPSDATGLASPARRCTLVTRLLAARQPSCEALAALLGCGPLEEQELMSTVLAHLESVLRARGAEEPGAVDALVALVKHAPWAAAGVAALSVSPGAGQAIQPAWLALVTAVTSRPHAWVAHAVIMNNTTQVAPSGQGIRAAISPATGRGAITANGGRSGANTTAVLVPSGALVAAALVHCARDDAVCRAAALDMLCALCSAFPQTEPGGTQLVVPPPVSSMPQAYVEGGAPARVVEAVHLCRSLAAVYPHWGPAVMMAFVPLAATCCALPPASSKKAAAQGPPASSAATAFMPASVLVSLAAPWAAALPRLLARLITPGGGGAAAAADMAAAAAAASGSGSGAGAAPPPPLQKELTPRTMHLDRFLGDSLQAVASQVHFPPAASLSAASLAKSGAARTGPALMRVDPAASQASACVCAIAGAALALSDLVTWHDGSGAAELNPLWSAMLTGAPPVVGGDCAVALNRPGTASQTSPPATTWPTPWVQATLRDCDDAASAVGTFLLDAHCDCSDEADAQSRIEAVVPLLVDAHCSDALLDIWCMAVRSRDSFEDARLDDNSGDAASDPAAPRSSTSPVADDVVAVSRARLDALERSALRLCSAAAATCRGCDRIAPHVPRLLHSSLALAPLVKASSSEQQQPSLAWLLLRGAVMSGAVSPNAGTQALLAHPQLYSAASASPLWATSHEAVPVLRALGAALATWRPGVRVAWRREAFAWLDFASSALSSASGALATPAATTASAQTRGLSSNLRCGLLVSLRVCAALAKQHSAPRDVLRLARCAMAAGACGEGHVAGAALDALPSGVGAQGAGSAPPPRSALSTGAGADAQHYAAATALAALALPPGPALRAALPLAESLLTSIGRAELGADSTPGSSSATAVHAVARSSVTAPASPLLLAGCSALSRFWFALPGVHTDTVAATMLLRGATLDPECTPCAVRLLDALAVAQADTLPADNWLLVLALLCAAVEAQTDSAGPVPRARRAVALLDSCGFALDEVADAFRALLAHGSTTSSPCRMAAGPATVFADALSSALALACPAPQLWAFAARACGRLARLGPTDWRPAALRLAAALLRARARSWSQDVLTDLAAALQRKPPPQQQEESSVEPAWLGPACAGEEAALAAALVMCGSSPAAGGNAGAVTLAHGMVASGLTLDGDGSNSDHDMSYGTNAGENAQLSGYAAAWLRDYITAGLAALPAGPSASDASDDSAYFVAPDAVSDTGMGVANVGAAAAGIPFSLLLGQTFGSGSGRMRVSDGPAGVAPSPLGPHLHSPQPSMERLALDVRAMLVSAPPAGSDWRAWHAWQQHHNAAAAAAIAAAAPVSQAAAAGTPPRAQRQSSADFDAAGGWHLPHETLGPSTSGDHLWWGGAASRLTVSSAGDAYEALPRSVSHASSAALAAQSAAPVDVLPRGGYPGRAHISGLQFPAEEDEDALFQRQRYLQQARG